MQCLHLRERAASVSGSSRQQFLPYSGDLLLTDVFVDFFSTSNQMVASFHMLHGSSLVNHPSIRRNCSASYIRTPSVSGPGTLTALGYFGGPPEYFMNFKWTESRVSQQVHLHDFPTENNINVFFSCKSGAYLCTNNRPRHETRARMAGKFSADYEFWKRTSNDGMFMIWTGFGRKRPWPKRYSTRVLLPGTKQTVENPPSA
jgi:hypothetical protein